MALDAAGFAAFAALLAFIAVCSAVCGSWAPFKALLVAVIGATFCAAVFSLLPKPGGFQNIGHAVVGLGLCGLVGIVVFVIALGKLSAEKKERQPLSRRVRAAMAAAACGLCVVFLGAVYSEEIGDALYARALAGNDIRLARFCRSVWAPGPEVFTALAGLSPDIAYAPLIKVIGAPPWSYLAWDAALRLPKSPERTDLVDFFLSAPSLSEPDYARYLVLFHDQRDDAVTERLWKRLLRDSTALERIIATGRADLASEALGRGEPPSGRCIEGEPLRLAAEKNFFGIVKILLEAGADPDLRQPLHAATGCPESVRLLLSAGANMEARDYQDRTPVHIALAGGRAGSAELLLRAGARTDVVDKRGAHLLHLAAATGNRPVVEQLLAEGADGNVRNEDGCTPLHWAAWRGEPELVGLLLRAGARPDVQDRNGATPLFYAAAWGGTPVLDALLEGEEDEGRGLLAWADKPETSLFRAAERQMRWGFWPVTRGLDREETEPAPMSDEEMERLVRDRSAERVKTVKLLLNSGRAEKRIRLQGVDAGATVFHVALGRTSGPSVRHSGGFWIDRDESPEGHSLRTGLAAWSKATQAMRDDALCLLCREDRWPEDEKSRVGVFPGCCGQSKGRGGPVD